jgi:hypothetical protein
MFSGIAERVFGHRVTLHPVRAIVFAALVLAAAAGLVALGRWTAPTAATRISNAALVGEACGTVAPATMPTRGCQQVLTRMYLGAPADVPCGTIAPPVMPSAGCQRVLESIYLGTGP